MKVKISFCNNVNVFIVTFDNYNASLINLCHLMSEISVQAHLRGNKIQ